MLPARPLAAPATDRLEQGLHVLAWDQLNAYDVVVADDVVFTQAAYEAFVAAQTGTTTEEADA